MEWQAGRSEQCVRVLRKPYLHGLDALRAGGVVAVVLLHAAVPYTVRPLTGLAWPVAHTTTSAWVDALFWPIEAAVMPLFLTVSGFVAYRSLLRVGATSFCQSRWRRLVWPFLAAAAVLLPLEIYLWVLGWVGDGLISWRHAHSLKLGELHRDLWGFSHLWYLQYLLIYSLLMALVPGTRLTQAAGQNGSRLLTLCLLMGCGACVLAWTPEVVLGFQHAFWPVPSKFLYCGLFFTYGAWRAGLSLNMSVSDDQTHDQRLNGTWLSLLGVLVWIGCAALLMGPWQPDLNFGWPRVALAMGLASFASLVSAGLLEFALTREAPCSAVVRWLSNASFWIYLVHHPLVALWQIALRDSGWPAEARFAMCAMGTLLVCLAAYWALVERTWLGRFLEGQPSSRTAVAVPTAVPPLPQADVALAELVVDTRRAA